MAIPKHSRGLMGFWADMEPGDIPAFQEWHNCEHITERLGIPGFNAGHRYRGMEGAPTFFMFYETDDTGVLASAPYHQRLNNPTPWTQRSLKLFRNADRNIYTLEAEAGAPPAIAAPYLYLLRFNLESKQEAKTLDWLGSSWLPALSTTAPVHRVRLYRVDAEVSSMMTSERKIYGGGAGALTYLMLCETAQPRAGESPEWRGLEHSLEGTVEHLGRMLQRSAQSFWLEISLTAP